jgi:hypothetical protein
MNLRQLGNVMQNLSVLLSSVVKNYDFYHRRALSPQRPARRQPARLSAPR